MRTRIWVGGVALATAAGLGWFLLHPAATERSAASATTGPAHTANPGRLNALLTAELPAPKGALTVRGRVIGPSGPVAGAVVVASADGGDETLSDLESQCEERCGRKLFTGNCPDAARQLAEIAELRRGEAPPLARTTSRADGSYELSGLENGALAVWVERSDGLIGLRRAVKPGSEGVDVEVGQGRTIRGRLSNDDGNPVAGASVTAIYPKSTRFFDAVSGADGSFAIGPVPWGQITVVASAPGSFPVTNRENLAVSSKLKLTLSAARRIGGTIQRDGRPVRGATVVLEGGHRKFRTTTGDGGKFVFSGLPPQLYTLTATEGPWFARSTSMLDPGKDVLDVALKLVASGSIAGTVRQATGEPVTGAKVHAKSAAVAWSFAEARTGSDGTFRVESLAAGKATLTVEAEGFLEAMVEEVEVVAGRTTIADISLQSASLFRGLVVDEAGSPVEDASVHVRHKVAPDLWSTASSRRDGTFSVDRLVPGPVEVWASKNQFREAHLDLAAPTTDARIALSRGAEVTGVVIDEENRPVVGARVLAWPDERPEDCRRNTLSTQSAEVTGPRGDFRIRGLDERPYIISAYLGMPRSDGRQASQRVTIHAPSTGPLRLQFAMGLSITGKVVDKDGKPIEEGTVHAVTQAKIPSMPNDLEVEGRLASAEVAPDGTFEIQHLRAETFELSASAFGKKTYRPASVLAKAGETGVVIVLKAEAAARGRVVQASGAPITDFKIGGGRYSDPRGAFEIPVKYSRGGLVFQAEGFAATRRKIEPNGDEDVDLGEIVLGRGRTLTGRVLDASTNAPLAEVLVGVDAPEKLADPNVGLSAESGAVATRADGSFTLTNLEPAPMALFAMSEGYRTAAQPLAPTETAVTLRLVKGAAIRGTVSDGAGKPVARGSAKVVGPRNALFEAEVKDGSFVLSGLPPGHFLVGIQVDRRGQFFTKAVDVPESGEVQVDFKEATGGTRLTVSTPEGTMPAFLYPGEAKLPPATEPLLLTVFAGAIEGERDGRKAVFAHLLPGPYTLVLVREEKDNTIELGLHGVQVDPGPEQTIAIPMPRSFVSFRAERL